MPLFQISKNLNPIKEKPCKLEKELQTLSEENLQLIFNIPYNEKISVYPCCRFSCYFM